MTCCGSRDWHCGRYYRSYVACEDEGERMVVEEKGRMNGAGVMYAWSMGRTADRRTWILQGI